MSSLVAAAFGNRFGNAPNVTPTASLTTPTYDASGVTTEPTWRRKPSWVTATGTDLLAHNPLTGGSSDVENPSLLISNDDGATWTTPAGLTNPIAAKPTSVGTAGNNADCFLLADPNTNQLVMCWMVGADATVVNGNNQNGIWYSTCTDASLATWTSRTQLFSLNGVAAPTIGPNEQEPKIVWDSVRGRYLFYTQDSATSALRVRISTGTNPVGTYGSATVCSLPIPGGETMWHMDIIQESSGRFVMAFCDNHTSGSLQRQGWLASSPDGINWKVAPRPIMKANSWAVSGVYRPTIQPARSGSGYDLIVSRHQNPDARLGLVRNLPATEVP